MLSEIIKKHYLAIILAVVTGAFAIAPHLCFIFLPANHYSGINIFKSSDEEAYMASVLSASLGRKDTIAPYLFEYRNKENPAYSLEEYALAKILRYTGISVGNLFLILKFIGAVSIFLLLYGLVYLINRNRVSAFLASFLIIMALGIIGQSAKSILDNIMWRGGNIEFWDYLRLLNPAFSGIFFFIALIAAFKLFSKPSIGAAIFAGVSLGVLFYLYLYFWTFILILLGLLLIYSLILKSSRQSLLFLISIAGGILIGLPQLLKLFIFYKNITTGAGGLFNQTVMANNGFLLEKVVLLSLFLYVIFCLVLYFHKKLDKNLLFPAFLILTGTIAVNQQVITGQSIQPHHYYFFTNLPVAYIALAVIFGYLLNLIRGRYLRLAIVVPVFTVIVLWGIGVQAASYNHWAPVYRRYQDYTPIFSWLKKNAASDSVIYSRDDVADIVSADYGYYIYSSSRASESFYLSDERREIPYFLRLRMAGIDSASAERYFADHKNEVGGWFFGQIYREKCGSPGCFPEEILAKLVSDYKEFLKKNIEGEVKKFKIDYLIWDKIQDPGWRISEWKFLEPIFETNGLKFFKVK